MATHNLDQPSNIDQNRDFDERTKTPVHPKDPRHAQKSSPPRAIGADGKYRAHVVVADDDSDMRHMIARSLRKAGYQVIEVGDGCQLLERLDEDLAREFTEQPDLVVSDIRMPGVTGLEVLTGLRHRDWAMPVILITAFGDEQTHQEAERLGATLLDKPFDLDDLLHAVRSILPPRF